MNDWDLLEQFRLTRSEPAFRELLTRHASFVLTSCRRRLRDTHLSEDAAQAVFVTLARRPPMRMASSHATLAGWLHQTANYVCNNAMQAKRSRERHERNAASETNAMRATDGATVSAEVEALLDDALARLSPRERDAVLLRFYQDQSVQQVGQALGISANTAVKRIGRAIERMRAFLLSNGLAISSPVLIEIMSRAMRSQTASSEFLTTTIAVAIGSSTASLLVQQLVEGVHQMMRIAKMKFVASVAVIVLGAGGAIVANQLIANPGDAKAAADAPKWVAAPTTAPAIVANTPKEALSAFAAAIRAGDSRNIRNMVTADTDNERDLARAAAAYVDATGALSAVVNEKFGAQAKKELDTMFEFTLIGRFGMMVEIAVAQSDEHIEGDSVRLQPPGEDDLNIWVVKQDGQWKLDTGRTCEEWTPDNWDERISLARMAAARLQEFANRVGAGEYQAFAKLKTDLGEVVRQNR